MSLKLDGDGDGLSVVVAKAGGSVGGTGRGDSVRGSGGFRRRSDTFAEAPPPSLISGHSCAYTAAVWHKAEACH